MEEKRVLVVCYSRNGNTKKIAEKIKNDLNCDIEEIIDTKNRKGLFGYIFAGRDALTKKQTIIEPLKHNPRDYDLVIVGTPVWAGTLASPIRTYLSQNSGKFKRVKMFITSGGKGNEKVISEMEEIIGLQATEKMMLLDSEIKKKEYENKIDEFIKKSTL